MGGGGAGVGTCCPGPLLRTMGSYCRETSMPRQGPPCLSFSLQLTQSGRPVDQQDSVLSSHVKVAG